MALEEGSDVRKCLIAFGIRKMGGTSRLFLLDQSDENSFGYRNFELNLEHLLFLSDANPSTDILPHF